MLQLRLGPFDTSFSVKFYLLYLNVNPSVLKGQFTFVQDFNLIKLWFFKTQNLFLHFQKELEQNCAA